jgi:hypothetical protein
MKGDLQHALECECCSKSADILHDFLAEADALVAKALKLSEIAQIARTEQRMRELLLGRWRLRTDQAAKAAGRAIAGGASISAALGRVDKIMAKWDDDVTLRYARDLEDIYLLARTAGHKKATGQTKASLGFDIPNFTEELDDKEVKKAKPGLVPKFDLFDKSAVAARPDDGAPHSERTWQGQCSEGVSRLRRQVHGRACRQRIDGCPSPWTNPLVPRRRHHPV